jgi:hypothetical protein
MSYKQFLNKTIPIFSFSQRSYNDLDLTIGFVGQARKDKGFHFIIAQPWESEENLERYQYYK